MGVSNPAFTCIKTKAVDDVQMISKTIIFTFCLLQPRRLDQSECKNVSHCKAQLPAERNFR